MIDSKAAFSAFKQKFDAMSVEERTKYLQKIGFESTPVKAKVMCKKNNSMKLAVQATTHASPKVKYAVIKNRRIAVPAKTTRPGAEKKQVETSRDKLGEMTQ